MATKRKKRPRRRSSSLRLPWEQRGGLRSLLAGPRWKIALASAVLLVVALAFARNARARHQRDDTRRAVAEMRQALETFRSRVGRCPASANELVHPPRSRVRYLQEVPTDAWGRELHVECPSRTDPDEVAVLSLGPSGSLLVDDNIY
ncbi:MAG: type II secretion system protein GspG [Myxococcota bacterium]